MSFAVRPVAEMWLSRLGATPSMMMERALLSRFLHSATAFLSLAAAKSGAGVSPVMWPSMS